MKTIFSLFKKDYRLFWNDKVAVSLTFFVPVMLILLFGAVFNRSSDPQGIKLGFISESNSPIAARIENTLDTMKTFRLIKTYKDDQGLIKTLDTNTVKSIIKKGELSSALIIPADAYTDTSSGLKIRFYYDPRNDIEMQLVQGMLQKTIMEQMPLLFQKGMQRQSLKYLGTQKGNLFNSEIASVVGRYFDVDTASVISWGVSDTLLSEGNSGTSGFGNFFSNILQIEKQQLVGKKITGSWATRNVGGWAMMFLLFSITASASSLFDEKKAGVMLRILSSPVSRLQILWSKYLFNISLGIIQLSVLFITGALFYDIDLFSNLPNLIIMVICGSLVCTAFGMLLAAFSRTAAQANGWGTFLILTMSAIGGAWFPTFLMPPFIQFLSKFTFVYWTIEGFIRVLWNRSDFLEILPIAGILLGITLLINSISVWRFKKGDIFR